MTSKTYRSFALGAVALLIVSGLAVRAQEHEEERERPVAREQVQHEAPARSEVDQAIERARRQYEERLHEAERALEEQVTKARKELETQMKRMAPRAREAQKDIEKQIERLAPHVREAGREMEEKADYMREAARYRTMDPPFGKELNGFVEREFPGELQRARELMREAPEQAHRELGEMRGFYAEMLEMSRENPEAFELEKEDRLLGIQTERLGDRMRNTENPKQRGQMAKELAELVERQFEVRQRMREREAEMLERELREVRASLERRAQQRQLIIKRRLEQLSGSENDFDW